MSLEFDESAAGFGYKIVSKLQSRPVEAAHGACVGGTDSGPLWSAALSASMSQNHAGVLPLKGSTTLAGTVEAGCTAGCPGMFLKLIPSGSFRSTIGFPLGSVASC